MNTKNFNIMLRYLEWKKENKIKEWISMLSALAMFLSFILVINSIPSDFVAGFGLSSYLIAFFILVSNWDKYLRNWYSSFSEDEIKQIEFFKENGFLK